MSQMVETLRTLGEETRLRILRLLREESLNVGELTRILGLAQPTVSKHLGELRRVGLIEAAKNSGYSYYRMTEDLDTWIQPLSLMLEELEDERGDMIRLKEVLCQRQERSETPDRFVVPGRSWSLWSRALAFLIPPMQVADFGCGDGTFTLEMATWARKVYGIDCNPSFLEMARQRTAHLKNVTLLNEDIRSVSLPDHAVDLVVISQSLHYLEKPAAAIGEAWRVLKEGGKILVVELLPHQESWLETELEHRWYGFNPRQVRKWLKNVGFDPVLMETPQRFGHEPFPSFILIATKPTETSRA